MVQISIKHGPGKPAYVQADIAHMEALWVHILPIIYGSWKIN